MGNGMTSDPVCLQGARRWRRSPTLIVLLVISLAGCATNRDREQTSAAGGEAVAVIGTPFYAVFKAVSCVATAAMAAPGAAALGLSETPHKEEWREDMNYSVGKNCGGSYILGAF